MTVRRIVAALLSCLTSCLAFAGGNAYAACAPERLSAVQGALLYDGRIILPVTVEGHSFSFLLDTGGVATTIKWDLAKRMGLGVQQTPRQLAGVAGSILNFVLAGKDFSVGALNVENRPIYLESRPLPGADGTLGADVLHDYDVEVDMTDPASIGVSLYSAGYCALPEWLGSPVAIDISHGGHVRVPVKIDGIPLLAMLDTGASTSVISLRAAARLGVRPNSPDLRPVGGNGLYRVYAYPFQSLELGGLVVKNPHIAIASNGLIPGNDIVLGIDALRETRFTIAYGSKLLYIKGPQHN